MDNKENEQINTPEEIQAIKTSEYMKETIKQRPINKRKLARRLLSSVAMAVVIGLVACVTFIVLEPVINKRINPEEEIAEDPLKEITFVEESAAEETLPEDMIADESELAPVIIEQAPLNDEQIEQVLSEMELGVEDYLSLNSAVASKAKEVQSSIVDVIGITQDMDWFNNEYENEHIISGVIVADNGRELLILANIDSLVDYDSLEVGFDDGKSYAANIKVSDKTTGLAIIAVNKNYLEQTTRDGVTIIEMGSTASRNLNGTPVVALGRPLGNVSSICIGTITSQTSQIEFTDGSYSCITTDIYGSTQASGVLINARGQLIGIIDTSVNSTDMQNLISGLGITDLKRLIERMSNGKEIPYLGIYGVDVTDDISARLDIPKGVYIKSMEMDSPLLASGMQSGDIIIRFDGTTVLSYQELKTLLLTHEIDDSVSMDFMRQGPDGYSELSVTFEIVGQP